MPSPMLIRAAIAASCLAWCGCSGAERAGPESATMPAEAATAPVVEPKSAAEGPSGIAANSPQFQAKIDVTTIDLSILGPTDVVPLDDETVYVLLQSAPGTTTGRPMAIVDVASGKIQRTATAPIPLSRPYGTAVGAGDLVVWNLAHPKHQPDVLFLETLHYERAAKLWRVVPPPESHLVGSAEVTRGPQGEARLEVFGVDGVALRYRLDRTSWAWVLEAPDAEEEQEAEAENTCIGGRAEGPDGAEWVTGAAYEYDLRPCAFKRTPAGVTLLPPPPSPRCLHTVVRGRNALWTVGGYDSCGRTARPTSDVVDRLIDGAEGWERLPLLPVPVYPSGALPLGETIVIFDQQMRAHSWDDEAGGWATERPVAGLENNSDWTPLPNNRVAALAWETGTNRTVNKLVILRFRPAGASILQTGDTKD